MQRPVRSQPDSTGLEEGCESGTSLSAVPPAALLLGVRERVAKEGSGQSTISFDPPPGVANMMGYVQGGFISAMLDSAMGLAVRSLLRSTETAPTLEMKVSYLRPASIGRLICTGRVTRLGGSVGFLEGDMHGPDGELLARATSTVRVVDVPHTEDSPNRSLRTSTEAS